MSPTTSRQQLRRSVAALAAITVAFGLAGCSDPGDPSATDSPTDTVGGAFPEMAPSNELSGSGDDTTDAFEVGPNWELSWTAEGAFAVELIAADGTSLGKVVQTADGGEGGTFVSDAGSFTLEVTAAGDWTIDVLDRSGEG